MTTLEEKDWGDELKTSTEWQKTFHLINEN